MSTSIIRHNWVEAAVVEFRRHFWTCGYQVPDNIRVSIGFTKAAPGKHKKALGQCVDRSMSKDDHFELFISPEVGSTGNLEVDKAATINILETIAHELCHATVGNQHGHQGAFIDCAAAVGFERPWRYTPAGEKMLSMINQILDNQGLFPAGAIVIPHKKTQGKALIKCQCEGCGYVAYVTRKNFEASGTPVCPNEFEAMGCEE